MTVALKKFFSTEGLPKQKLNNFNIIRLVAAIMVIYGHACHLVGVPVFTLFGQSVSTIGVKIFFVVSGYLITLSYMRDSNIVRYSLRRFFRIVPGLVLLCLVSVFGVGLLLTSISRTEYMLSVKTYEYFLNILFKPIYFLPGLFENNVYPNAVNGSLWSLQIEVYMYFIMPVFVCIFKKLKILKVGIVVSAIFFIVLNIVKLKYFPSAVYVFWGNNIFDAFALVPYFFVGAIFTFPKVKSLLNLQWGFAFLAIPLLIRLGSVKTELLLTFVLSYFIFSFALAPNAVFAKIGLKNDYSYGLYLYGFVVQQVVMLFLAKYNLGLNIYFVICTAISFVCAFVSWHLVEKPFQNLCKKILKSKKISSL